jgi:hypothetical protein
LYCRAARPCRASGARYHPPGARTPTGSPPPSPTPPRRSSTGSSTEDRLHISTPGRQGARKTGESSVHLHSAIFQRARKRRGLFRSQRTANRPGSQQPPPPEDARIGPRAIKAIQTRCEPGRFAVRPCGSAALCLGELALKFVRGQRRISELSGRARLQCRHCECRFRLRGMARRR